MELKEILSQYGNEILNFSRYYKYSFSFTKTMSNGTTIHVSVGGNRDDIYRFEAAPFMTLNQLNEQIYINSIEIVKADGISIRYSIY